MTNRPEYLASVFGIALAGGVTVSLSTFSTPLELEYLLQAGAVSILLYERQVLNKDFGAMLGELEPGIADGRARRARLHEIPVPAPRRRARQRDGERKPGRCGWRRGGKMDRLPRDRRCGRRGSGRCARGCDPPIRYGRDFLFLGHHGPAQGHRSCAARAGHPVVALAAHHGHRRRALPGALLDRQRLLLVGQYLDGARQRADDGRRGRPAAGVPGRCGAGPDGEGSASASPLVVRTSGRGWKRPASGRARIFPACITSRTA